MCVSVVGAGTFVIVDDAATKIEISFGWVAHR